MATIRPFSIYDLLEYNNINLDILTETFAINFYGKYIAKWPEYCVSLANSTESIYGYLLGKVEGSIDDDISRNWHGHVTAITVSSTARRQGIGRYLMNYLEEITNDLHKGWYVDQFVRAGNTVAIQMYRNLGYCVYQTVYKYYSASGKEPSENAADMRKPMERNKEGTNATETGMTIEPKELEFS